MNRRGLLGSLFALPFVEKVKAKLVPFKFSESSTHMIKTDDSIWIVTWGEKTVQLAQPRISELKPDQKAFIDHFLNR